MAPDGQQKGVPELLFPQHVPAALLNAVEHAPGVVQQSRHEARMQTSSDRERSKRSGREGICEPENRVPNMSVEGKGVSQTGGTDSPATEIEANLGLPAGRLTMAGSGPAVLCVYETNAGAAA